MMKGFHEIKNTHKELLYQDKMTRFLKKYSNRHMKVNGADAFNKWKLNNLQKVD